MPPLTYYEVQQKIGYNPFVGWKSISTHSNLAAAKFARQLFENINIEIRKKGLPKTRFRIRKIIT